MDVALDCWLCGTPATGSRFCTGCGTLLAGRESPPAPSRSAPAAYPAPDGLPTSPVGDGSCAAEAADRCAGEGTDTLVGIPIAADDPGGSPPWAAVTPDPSGEARPGWGARQTWRGVLAVLVVAALGLSAWVLMHGTERHVLSGTVLLADSSVSTLNPGDGCSGAGGYSDINAGAQVVLTDGKGSTLATAVLSDGRGCVFSFVLRDVRHTDFYALSVAGSNRGQLQYSYDQLAHDSWSVRLSLGDN